MNQQQPQYDEDAPMPPRVDNIGEAFQHAEEARKIINGSASIRRGEVAVVKGLLAIYYQLCELTDMADKNGRDIGDPLNDVLGHVKHIEEIARDWEETESTAVDERTDG